MNRYIAGINFSAANENDPIFEPIIYPFVYTVWLLAIWLPVLHQDNFEVLALICIDECFYHNNCMFLRKFGVLIINIQLKKWSGLIYQSVLQGKSLHIANLMFIFYN